MSKAVETLLSTLDLEPIEVNLFRGISPKVGWQRVFGGQVIGQALVAAQRTVEAQRKVHSLHGYFMRPGDPESPIIYEVKDYCVGLLDAHCRTIAQSRGGITTSSMGPTSVPRLRWSSATVRPVREDGERTAAQQGARLQDAHIGALQRYAM